MQPPQLPPPPIQLIPQHSLFLLRLKGVISCCLFESPDDRTARLSAAYLQSRSYWRVQWHRRVQSGREDDRADEDGGGAAAKTKTKDGKGFAKLMSSFVSSVVQSTASATGSGVTISEAELTIVDAPHRQGPAVRIISGSTTTSTDHGALLNDSSSTNGSVGTANTSSNGDTDAQRASSRKGMKLVLLRKIGAILPRGNTGIVIYGKPLDHSSPGQGTELLRYNVMRDATTTTATSTTSSKNSEEELSDIRDEMMEHLINLVEWDRRKRGHVINDSSDVDDDDVNNDGRCRGAAATAAAAAAGGMKGRAQKAADFAKREIEMQQRRREREARKAKYLQASGGLKYTALAMAQREG